MSDTTQMVRIDDTDLARAYELLERITYLHRDTMEFLELVDHMALDENTLNAQALVESGCHCAITKAKIIDEELSEALGLAQSMVHVLKDKNCTLVISPDN
ncbi:MAG: hypothetical protein E7337_08985 [Clostridiales bacterium]|nr:hypothetical protein [Clostridiales bacterium]